MKNLLILPLLFIAALAWGQQPAEPIDIAGKLFGREQLSDLSEYITGEYIGQPNGTGLADSVTTTFLLIEQNDSTAVVSMTATDLSGEGMDCYLFFTKDTTWKMSAFRSLAMTGFVAEIKRSLEALTPEQIEETIASAKRSEGQEVLFTSREAYDFLLGNATLILDLDENIMAHFTKNKKEFERLKDLASAQLATEDMDAEQGIRLIEDLESDYQKLYITAVSVEPYGLGRGINFLIGGMIDNTVGYLYVKDKKELPDMHPSRVILIREIGDGWYLYKTT